MEQPQAVQAEQAVQAAQQPPPADFLEAPPAQDRDQSLVPPGNHPPAAQQLAAMLFLTLS